MNEKFPYGYDLNAYIDKAFEQMKADFPWATRDMTGDMKKMTIVMVVMLVMAVFMPTQAFAGNKDSVEVDLLDISEMPKTAVRQGNAHFQYAVYVNVDKPASGEGVMSLDWEKKEIVAASYGYDDDGRYSVNKAYSLEGKFLREIGGKERE